MKPNPDLVQTCGAAGPEAGAAPRPTRLKSWLIFCLLALVFPPADARASIFKGEALDKMAGVLTWIVLIVVPIVAIGVFWLVHILPEKIAERRKHPQAKAIQVLCLLSLAFGGLLWPLAWLWAYTKPVLHKIAYGTDTEEHGRRPEEPSRLATHEEAEELKQLRNRITQLETKLAGKTVIE